MTFECNPHGYQRKYYKGEGDDFPSIRVVVSFVNTCMFVICPCTKVL